MTSLSFRDAVHLALTDVVGRRRLHEVLRRLDVERSAGWAATPDAAALQARARAARQAAIARMPALVDALAERMAARGVIVHRAATAGDAARAVEGIVTAGGEEVALVGGHPILEEVFGEALPGAATTVADYLLRHAGEPPAHPVARLAHMSVRDVADLLGQVLGRTVRPDIPRLVDLVARRVRQGVDRATVAVAGVHFADAETGTLVVLGEEGDRRRTWLRARVYVAIMGMDAVVPHWEDVPLLLQVWARAATGQPMPPEVLLIQGPVAGEGPQEVHLIIVDNGRTDILADGFGDALMCIHCGACATVCPLFREVGAQVFGSPYVGPIGSVLSPLFWPDTHRDLAYASTLCGACRGACPVGIDIPHLMARLRARAWEAGRTPSTRGRARLWSWLTARHPLAQTLARAGRSLMRAGWLKVGRTLWPLPESTSFDTLWRSRFQ